ncbi:MAG TPA: ABC transporter ATP-binding protein [Candidatus Saccharimonadales bacterium]|nr:ABC transporter ATP-binding protein [Candidatus Saccharimonadales bacterium]
MTKPNKPTTKQTLRIYWQFTQANKFYFWVATVGSVIGVIANDIVPQLMVAQAFNHLQKIYAAHAPATVHDLLPYFIGYSIATILSMGIWQVQAKSSWKYMILTEKRIMEHIFDHLQTMDDSFHANRFGGALVSQTNKFVSAYDSLAAAYNWNIVNGITAFVVSLAVLIIVSPWYALAFTVFSFFFCLVLADRMKKQIPYNRKLASRESENTAKLADTITNVATVRAFAGEDVETKLFHRQTGETKDAYWNLMQVQMRNELISRGGVAVVKTLAFGLGMLGLILLHAPIGALYLTITYTLSLAERLWQFMFIIKNINRALGDATEMTGILQLEPTVKDLPNPEPARLHRGRIELKSVNFSYGEKNRKPLFNDLSMTIKPGEKVGLVGHSGGGKSSLVKLLSRFMDIDSGQILIDSQNIRNIRQRDVRKAIAYVPQEPLLFHRSLIENIRYGQPDASDEQVYAVAKMAHADDFIRELPQGYDTLVGERGVKLSGGQRQRVAIARAMLKNAPILVLDEATSALDSESEALIQDALWKLMEGRTAIVIAHRLSTIQKMDRIIVLDGGKVVEEGSHKDLLRMDGVYAKLWTHQSGGFIDDDGDNDEN